MATRRLLQDLDHATSVLLLLAVVAASVTGFLSDVWDLDDVAWHRWSGYAMAALAVAHVAFNLDRIVAYWRTRSRQGVRRLRAWRSRASRDVAPVRSRRGRVGRPTAPRDSSTPRPRAGAVTRRVLLTTAATTAGALGGWAVARRVSTVSDPVGNDAGMVYHQLSRPGVADAIDAVVTWGDRPAPPKQYPEAPVVALSRAGGGVTDATAADEDLSAVVLRRRSVRDYAERPLTTDELSRLLSLTAGRSGPAYRTMPSAGALYPIEVYAVVHAVDGLDRGLYHYDAARHVLHVVERGDLRGRVVRQGFGQSFLGEAGVVLCLTIIPDRMRFRYRHRSYRYSMLEAGHIGQNAYLAATATGLGACAVGAFLDDDLNDMLGVDGSREAAVYLLAVGAR